MLRPPLWAVLASKTAEADEFDAVSGGQNRPIHSAYHETVWSSTLDFLPHFYHSTAQTTGKTREQEGPKALSRKDWAIRV